MRLCEPDFLCLQGPLLERDRSRTGIRLNARFDADLEAPRARNSALTNPESEWAHIDRLSRLPDINLRWTSEFVIMRQEDADWLCTHSGELPNHNCIVKGSLKQERPER